MTAALPPGALDGDDAVVAWRRIVEFVQAKGALIAARLVLPSDAALERAAYAGFDLLVIDPGREVVDLEALPAHVARAKAKWRAGAWVAAVVHDHPTRTAVVGHAAQLVRAGADLLWVTAPDVDARDRHARLPAAPLADRLRNELGVATCVDGADATLPDLDAAIAAGRADLVVVERFTGAPRARARA